MVVLKIIPSPKGCRCASHSCVRRITWSRVMGASRNWRSGKSVWLHALSNGYMPCPHSNSCLAQLPNLLVSFSWILSFRRCLAPARCLFAFSLPKLAQARASSCKLKDLCFKYDWTQASHRGNAHVENMEIVKPAVPRVSPAVCLKSFNMFSESFNIPSGTRLHISYGKSQCFTGKSTINIYQWAIFNSYVAVDQRISPSRFQRLAPQVMPGFGKRTLVQLPHQWMCDLSCIRAWCGRIVNWSVAMGPLTGEISN